MRTKEEIERAIKWFRALMQTGLRTEGESEAIRSTAYAIELLEWVQGDDNTYADLFKTLEAERAARRRRSATDMPICPENRDAPLERGFMRNGFFAWPSRNMTCADCAVVFMTTSHADRCAPCRAKHRREWHQAYDKRRRQSCP